MCSEFMCNESDEIIDEIEFKKSIKKCWKIGKLVSEVFPTILIYFFSHIPERKVVTSQADYKK